jgi:aminopeptidase N
VTRLALLGGLEADEIEEERRRDGTAQGELGAARALAARPTAQAKAEAWAALTEDDVSNRSFEAVAAGLWPAEQAALAAPYLPAYLAEGPRWAARGPAFSLVVGSSFPAFHLDADQLELLREALAGELPTVLRRHWEDVLDDRA